MKQTNSKVYTRAKAMVLQDKFRYRQNEFYSDLSRLVSSYMEYDGMNVDVTRGENANMVITVSVKKIKPTSRPLS